MNDVAPDILEKVTKQYDDAMKADKSAAELLNKVKNGAATYVDASKYAEIAGDKLSKALTDNISSDILPDGKMYYNIAQRVLQPTLEENHDMVADVATDVQQRLNDAAGIGLKAQRPELNQDRIDGIINQISSADKYDDVAWILGEPITNYSMSTVDDAAKKNLDFQGMAGLKPKIIRKSEYKCCKWCSALAGTYSYPDVPDDVYKRHENCRCQVEYNPGSGKKVNVHIKKPVPNISPGIDLKTVGLYDEVTGDSGLAGNILKNTKLLSTYSPEELKTVLESNGYDVKPLGKGNFKNIPYEEGGGYRVNFDGDGIIQYHPEKQSHHGGEYYKVGNGKMGIKRYDRNGRPKYD